MCNNAKKKSYVDNDKDVETIIKCAERISSDPLDPSNYVRRSRQFIKLSQLFYASEDARKLIDELCPKSPIGYKLMNEICSASELYEDAIKWLEAGYRACGQDFTDYKKLKNIAQTKLNQQNTTEKMSLMFFLMLGFAGGIFFVLLANRLSWLDLVKRTEANRITTIIICLALSYAAHRVYFQGKRTYRNTIMKPPYDVMGAKEIQSLCGFVPDMNEFMGDKKSL